jgi:hypothetical protein
VKGMGCPDQRVTEFYLKVTLFTYKQKRQPYGSLSVYCEYKNIIVVL